MRIVIQPRRRKVWATKRRDWAAYQIRQINDAMAMEMALWEQEHLLPNERRTDA